VSIPKKAVCLLSGGLDSSTCLALARREGYACYALSFDYGQRHKFELEAAARSRGAFRRRAASGHENRPRRVRRVGADGRYRRAQGAFAEEMSHGIPITYVPARNTIFLSFALAWAEVLEAPTFSSASTRSITPAIPIAVRNTSRRTNAWPTWRRRPAWKAHAADHPHAAAQLSKAQIVRWRAIWACRSG
jgi:hypothetical protein